MRLHEVANVPVHLAMVSGCGTYLVYHVDKGLGVVPKEATDCIARILTQEELLDQGREFMRSKRASDQTLTGWSVEVEKRKRPGASVLRTRMVKLKAYHSWIRRVCW